MPSDYAEFVNGQDIWDIEVVERISLVRLARTKNIAVSLWYKYQLNSHNLTHFWDMDVNMDDSGKWNADKT